VYILKGLKREIIDIRRDIAYNHFGDKRPLW